MSTFELYMLATGWDAVCDVLGIGGLILSTVSTLLVCSTYFADIDVAPQWVKKRKTFLLLLIVSLTCLSFAALIPNCEDVIKIYSAKYGEQEIQHMLEIFRRK